LRVSKSRTILAAMSPVAIYLLVICFAGGAVACGAFVWAVLHGEFTDASEAAFLVFDDADSPPPAEKP
jgi:nitrogen fixation-related uncharacterized protein